MTFPSAAVTAETASTLALVASDPCHADARSAIEATIYAAAAADRRGVIDPGTVREALPRWVEPRLIGATYSALARAGVIEVAGWTFNTDRKSRNANRPQRCWKLGDAS